MQGSKTWPDAVGGRSPARRPAAMIGIGLVSIAAAGAAIGGAASAAVPSSRTTSWSSRTVTSSPSRATRTTSARPRPSRYPRGTRSSARRKGVVAEGDVAFEVNHPGGCCWGAGNEPAGDARTSRPGDQVSISFDGARRRATPPWRTRPSTRLRRVSERTLRSRVTSAPGVNRAQLEQRVVNPDLTATDVARRDIRAVPGGLHAAPKGGYSSEPDDHRQQVHGDVRVRHPETARIAANGGGER